MSATVGDSRGFWKENQPGFRFTDAEPGTEEFYAEVERHRYQLEPHILDVVRFGEWTGRDVLEIGCGVATDGARFARAGARYSAAERSDSGIALARRRFELEGLQGTFVQAPATELPFENDAFDLVYSHGVIHHVADDRLAVAEVHRVLRPGGVALLMLYHRDSLNYGFNILVVRRALAGALLIPGAASLLARAVGEAPEIISGHRELLREHGLRYLTDRQLFLSNNTDGPGNPLSRVFSRAEARELFTSFDDVATTVRFLNLRLFPGGDRLAATRAARVLERRIGWHLYVAGRKPRA